MSQRPIDHRARRTSVQRQGLARWLAIGFCLAAITVLEAGCVVTPRQPATSPTPPLPQVPENAAGSAQVHQNATVGAKTDFHETATDEQRFHVHLDFGRVFETQGNLDAAVLEYQEAITVVETTRRGPFRPLTRPGAPSDGGCASIGWDDSLRPRCTTRRPSSSARKTRRSGTTPATAITSRAVGPMPSGHSRRRPSSLPTTNASRSTWASRWRPRDDRKKPSSLEPVERRWDRPQQPRLLAGLDGPVRPGPPPVRDSPVAAARPRAGTRALTRLDRQQHEPAIPATSTELLAKRATAVRPVDPTVHQASTTSARRSPHRCGFPASYRSRTLPPPRPRLFLVARDAKPPVPNDTLPALPP